MKMNPVGVLIKERVDQLGMSYAEFGRRINRSPQNVADLFKRKTVDTDMLAQIGEVLDFDFFQYYTRKKQNPKLEDNAEVLDYSPKLVPTTQIKMLIELDGTDATAVKWVRLIHQINKSIQDSK